jgi:hypothetical protein
MVKKAPFRFFAFLIVLALLQISANDLLLAAANDTDKDDKNPHLSGRILDEKKKKPLADTKVQITDAAGQSRETQTDKNGCYDFEKVAEGTYSLLVNYKDNNFTLPEKIKVEGKKNLVACAALVPKEAALTIITKNCTCRVFPLIIIVLGTAAGLGLLIPQQQGPEEASPSRP